MAGSIFIKLAIGFAINTCALPILLGTFPLGISQAWYEHGGVITTAMYQATWHSPSSYYRSYYQ